MGGNRDIDSIDIGSWNPIKVELPLMGDLQEWSGRMNKGSSFFPHLFTPGSIGTMTVKNRIVMAPVSTKYSSADGEVTHRYIDYFVERARGGTAFLIVENTCVDWPRGKGGVNPVRIDRDRFIPGLSDLAEEVHFWGAKIATQIQHVGRQTNLRVTEGVQPIAPSPTPGCGQNVIPKEMNREDILEVVELFGEAARRTKQAGFDAVEIHGAHGYVITQFLSPFLNRRTDEFGGSLENRLRVPLAIVRRVREAVGPDFPVIFRYSADEAVPGGLGVEEAKVVARRLEEAGVNALHVSSGLYESPYRIFPVMAMPMACYASLAEAIKKEVRIPVIAVGKINQPALAEEILAKGQADFVAIGRQLLADPDFPNKAREGRAEEIRPCLSCNNGCIGRLPRQWRLRCDVNPALGKEREYKIRAAKKRKRVMIVGGGPAGMQCAIDAAAGGHEVSLFEQDSALGGLLNLACKPPGKEQIRLFRDYLIGQVNRSPVDVKVHSAVDLNRVRQVAPDVLVIATGSKPSWGGMVEESEGIWGVEDVLRDTPVNGKNVLVVGGGQVGSEVAEYLAVQGQAVTIVELLDDIALDMEHASRMHLKMRLDDLKVTILTHTRALKVRAQEVEVLTKNGPARLRAGAIVMAVGYVPRQELMSQIQGENLEVYSIGDCVKPRKIYEAIHEGAHLARVLCQ
jgi:2,4-dienoyl-CoA reductase-like NADH-dependent reductase (Old Yellow Enzyme family)/thioredoxin reductase